MEILSGERAKEFFQVIQSHGVREGLLVLPVLLFILDLGLIVRISVGVRGGGAIKL